MLLSNWEPMREFENMFDRYSRLLWRPTGDGINLIASEWSPRVDISETENNLVIKAEIPDVNKDDIKVTVSQGILTIEGEKKREKDVENEKYHRIERYYGSFARSFTLPTHINDKDIHASFKNGVLSLVIPKIPTPESREIQVKIN